MDSTAILPQPPTQIRRKITLDDMREVAKMVVYRMTETEACLQLDIQPKHWFSWKNKAKRMGKFEEIMTRIRGARLAGNLEQIKKAAEGKDGVRHDWRAADRLNAVISPDRYAQAQAGNVTTNQIVIAAGGEEQLRKLIAVYVGQKEINAGTCQETSLLADAVKSQDNSTKPADSSKAIDF